MEDVVPGVCRSEVQEQEDCSQQAQYSLISDVEASSEDLRKSYLSPSELSAASFSILQFHTFHSLFFVKLNIHFSLYYVHANSIYNLMLKAL